MKPIAFLTMFAILATTAAASAQTPPRRIQAPASRFSIDTRIDALMANPTTRAALERHMPGLVRSQWLPQVQHMTVRELAASPHAQIPSSRVQALQADLVRIR